MHYKWPLVIGKNVPDIIADDYNFVLNNNHVQNNCETGRFFYEIDYLEDCQPVCDTVRNL